MKGQIIDTIKAANEMANALLNYAAEILSREGERKYYRTYLRKQKYLINVITRIPPRGKLPRATKQVQKYAKANSLTTYQWQLLMQRFPELKPWMDQTDKKLKWMRKK